MAATRMVGDTEGGAAVAGGYLSWKRSETDTPPVLLILVPTHTSTHTHLHTTHLRHRHCKKGPLQMVRCTLPL